MAIAQQLYEGVEVGGDEPGGLITYMRTDSTQVSEQAQQEARSYARQRYGDPFVPEEPPQYRTRSRSAQEAHEAIRPTSVQRTPELIRDHLSTEQFKLYRLIWTRFLASQMSPAEYDTLTIEVDGETAAHRYSLRVSASSLRFAGFLEVYEDVAAENGEADEEELQVGLRSAARSARPVIR